MKTTTLNCADKTLDLSHPQVMGILNVTPDSFADGGRYTQKEAALTQARRMVDEGAAIIDVGGESTRPGAQLVSVEEELARVVPVIESIRAELDVVISVDTTKAEVMRTAVAAGANLVNDVMALQGENALQVVADLDVPVCLMHMQGEPRTMQRSPHYDDVVKEVQAFIRARIDTCLAAGIKQDNIILDPGFGFGKTLEHNLSLLRHLETWQGFGLPLLVGVSRKSMIGTLLDDRPVGERLYGSVALATLAVWLGASIIRAHDVRPTVDALKVCWAVKHAQ